MFSKVFLTLMHRRISQTEPSGLWISAWFKVLPVSSTKTPLLPRKISIELNELACLILHMWLEAIVVGQFQWPSRNLMFHLLVFLVIWSTTSKILSQHNQWPYWVEILEVVVQNIWKVFGEDWFILDYWCFLYSKSVCEPNFKCKSVFFQKKCCLTIYHMTKSENSGNCINYV